MGIHAFALVIDDGQRQELLAHGIIEAQHDFLGRGGNGGFLVGLGLDQNGMGHGIARQDDQKRKKAQKAGTHG